MESPNTVESMVRHRAWGYKTIFMLISAEHKIYPAHNFKMPTIDIYPDH